MRAPAAAVEGGRTPTNETGVYVFHHTHIWREIGARLWPVGTWHPLFRCDVCTDVICDLSIDAHTGERSS